MRVDPLDFELWNGDDDSCAVCGAPTCRLASPEEHTMDISYENFEEALGQLLPESVRRWHRERQDLGGVGELQLNLCRNGHFSGVCWERESAEREGALAWVAARAGISVEEMLTRTESSPDLPPVALAPITQAAFTLPADYVYSEAHTQQRAADKALVRQLLSAHPDGLAALERLTGGFANPLAW